jgi:hypothetical protein
MQETQRLAFAVGTRRSTNVSAAQRIACQPQALPLLGAVALMLLMFVLLYAVAAVQMFTSVYHNVCMGPDPLTGEVSIS